MAKLLNTFAPPFSLVGAYFFVGIFFLICSVFVFGVVDLDSIFDFKSAVFFHLFLVGFVVSLIIGSLYQLSSVILNKAFFTLKGAYVNLLIYAIALAILLVGGFGEIDILMPLGFVLLFCSLAYFDITYILTFLGVKKLDFASSMLLISAFMLLGGLLCAIGLVGILFLDLGLDFMLMLRFHLYFVFGFIFFVIVSASSTLLPMFSLAHNVSFGFFIGGILAYLWAFVLLILGLEFIYLIFTAILLVGIQFVLILKHRVRRPLDYWNLNILLSSISLAVAILCYIYIGFDIAIFILFYGALYPFVTGHIYKIMPFLIWYAYVSKFVGKMKVPLLEDMINKKIAYIAMSMNVFSLVAIFISKHLAIICVLISVILVAFNMLRFLKYIKFGEKNGR